ncbi:hypothetical protein M9H77_12639 [Catharanthus roseus]|uniref:Uncharacterized protein n=1 Tax=Catharanthus roseus TaxID=4058 RepID=A0ACC0BHW5_CATRO|nr:hypothetical protein M9H77_12639 [Catharanthus roseus]
MFPSRIFSPKIKHQKFTPQNEAPHFSRKFKLQMEAPNLRHIPTIYQVVFPWLLSQLIDVLACLTSSHQDFLRYNPLSEQYAYVKVPNDLYHLKLIYDSISDPEEHIMRYISQMYMYNASDSTYFFTLPSSLTGRILIWPKPALHDRLRLKKPEISQYSYMPPRIPRLDVLQQVEPPGILDKPT